jgi:hypothetical protein
LSARQGEATATQNFLLRVIDTGYRFWAKLQTHNYLLRVIDTGSGLRVSAHGHGTRLLGTITHNRKFDLAPLEKYLNGNRDDAAHRAAVDVFTMSH